MNLLDLLAQKIELFRLEQRYTRRRNRRSTFVSEAQYVDGEYIYSPTSSYSAKVSTGSSDSDEDSSRPAGKGGEASTTTTTTASSSKPARRLSKMGLDKMDWKRAGLSKRHSTVNVREVKWDEGVRG